MKVKILSVICLVMSVACLSLAVDASDKNTRSKTKKIISKPVAAKVAKAKKPVGGCWYCYQGSSPTNDCHWGCFGETAPGNNPCEGSDCYQENGLCVLITGCIQDEGFAQRTARLALQAGQQIDQTYLLNISEETIREAAKSHPRIAAILATLNGKPARVGVKIVVHAPPMEISTSDVEHWINRNTPEGVIYHENFILRSAALGKILATEDKNSSLKIEIMPSIGGLEITIPDNPWTGPMSLLRIPANYRLKENK